MNQITSPEALRCETKLRHELAHPWRCRKEEMEKENSKDLENSKELKKTLVMK
jgi:hypothetical protein